MSSLSTASPGGGHFRVSITQSTLRLHLIELTQIRRRLIPTARHQVAVLANEIGLALDDDQRVVLVTDEFGPDRLRIAAVSPRHRPGPREGMVDDRDLVVERVVLRLVERDALLGDGL